MSQTALAAIEIGLVNDLRQIAGVAAKIDDFCASREISPQAAYAVNLAIEELLSITIENGYQDDDPHRIEVILRQEGDTLAVIIVDDADPFDPARTTADSATPSLEQSPDAGLGLLLVNQMMDEVTHQRHADCNVTTLLKRTAE